MVAGDVVNTAARLQSAAPVNGILVGETTYRATDASIDYRERDAGRRQGQGRAGPRLGGGRGARSRSASTSSQRSDARWSAASTSSRAARRARTRAAASRTPQLVTLVGVPGIGKSRLVYELFASVVDADPDLITWRQGRSLPYGEGVAFWALGEMVKAAGRASSRPTRAEAAARSSRATVADCIADAGERALGRGPSAAAGRARQRTPNRAATGATRRSPPGAASSRRWPSERPLVLVFEDLHWADDDLLDFVDASRRLGAAGVPLLVVCHRAARAARAPAGLGRREARTRSTVSLAPLVGRRDGAAPRRRCCEQAVAAGRTAAGAARARRRQPALRGAVSRRMLVERGVGRDELPLPETVQGIIAARLDALSAEDKRLLQDAAVARQGVLARRRRGETTTDRVDGRGAPARARAQEFVRRERRSSVAGEPEYAFRTSLVRDVAYGQIPRARARREAPLAAEWIETLGADRRGPRRDARPPLPRGARSSRGPRAARTRARPIGPQTRSATRASAPSASAPSRLRHASSEQRWTCGRTTILSGGACCSATGG